jgi:3-hydroxy-9,10-secoandrosta-1,3,5(10)-triene-9,17-dione monooxygenase reductase component
MSSPSDPQWFRTVLGHYPTGVCVVSAVGSDGVPIGMTVGSFSSASLSPPLVSFLPDRSSSTWPKIAAVRRFCVNVLAHDQEAVCRRFASKAPDKFAGLAHSLSAAGMPILDGVVAWIDCDLHATYEAGDHLIVLGHVHSMAVTRPVAPLLFFRGGYGQFSPFEPDPKGQ